MSHHSRARTHRSGVLCGAFFLLRVTSGNTKGGSIIVPLTSCLTGLDQSALAIKRIIVSRHTADSKPVKQEVNGTVILPLLVFPGYMLDFIEHMGHSLMYPSKASKWSLLGCITKRVTRKLQGKLDVSICEVITVACTIKVFTIAIYDLNDSAIVEPLL